MRRAGVRKETGHAARDARGVARGVMQEQLPSVRHGDWVLVDDVAGYEGRVIVVIGVIAVIRVRREDGGGDACRAAESTAADLSDARRMWA
jgi:hypothetical protein